MTQPHPDDDTRFVIVYESANEVDAGAVRAALDAEGIGSQLVGDRGGNAFPIPAGFSGPQIWVHESDAVAARAIIDRLQDQLGDETAEMDTLDGEPDGEGLGN